MNCGARSGFANYCGYAEYVPLNPPNYYHTQTLSGTFVVKTFTGSACTGVEADQTLTYSGASSYNSTTCAKTIGGQFSSSGAVCSTVVETQENIGQGFGAFCTGCGCGGIITESATVFSIAPTSPGFCIVCGGGFEGAECTQGPWQSVLSDRDTEEQAVARATVGTPYSGTDCGANYSYTTTVLPGQTEFAYQDAQVQVVLPTPKPGGVYQVTVTLLERATGSGGTLTPYGTLAFQLTAPATGPAASAFQQIPLVQGLEIHATACSAVELT